MATVWGSVALMRSQRRPQTLKTIVVPKGISIFIKTKMSLIIRCVVSYTTQKIIVNTINYEINSKFGDIKL